MRVAALIQPLYHDFGVDPLISRAVGGAGNLITSKELAPRGIEPRPPALESSVLTTTLWGHEDTATIWALITQICVNTQKKTLFGSFARSAKLPNSVFF